MGDTTILDGDTNNNTRALLLGQGISSTTTATTTSSSANTFITDMDATTTRSQNLITSTASSDDADADSPPQIHDKARKYRSLLSAYAGSMKPKGIGDLWGGQKNKGFLCERTQRAIVTRQVPKYVDKSIPGMTGMEVAMGSMEWDDEPEREGKQLRLKKFTGLRQNMDVGSDLEDIDPELAAMYDDEDDTTRDEKKMVLGHSDESYGTGSDFDNYEEKAEDDMESDYYMSNIAEESEETEDYRQDDESHLHQHLFAEGNFGTIPSTSSAECTMYDDSNAHNNNDTISQSLQVGREEHDLDDFEREMPVGLPKRRVEKLRKVFQASLAEPSMLELIPLLRENVPEDPDLAWLQKKNLQNAYFVMEKAEEEGLVDIKLLNNMLEVITNANLIGRALSYHETQYKQRDLEPDSFSDRLIIEMLIRNKRISNALEFKDKVVEQKYGRFLDLFAYGCFVDYYGKQYQLGSALLMLKECIDIHGFPPYEKTLARVRLMCRQGSLEQHVNLEMLIGKDPHEWIRRNARLKREKSKKGRRHVIEIQNKALRA
jgi:hypothetical protein